MEVERGPVILPGGSSAFSPRISAISSMISLSFSVGISGRDIVGRLSFSIFPRRCASDAGSITNDGSGIVLR